MAEKEKVVANGKDQKILQHDIEEIEKKVDEVQQMETSNKDQIVASKSFIYVIIALLVYLIFLVIPDIDEKVTWMEKDLNSVLVQSERFKKSTRVFAKDNQCASCHLSPDFLLHNLLIDDHLGNIQEFRKARGIGVHHTSASNTIKQLEAIGYK